MGGSRGEESENFSSSVVFTAVLLLFSRLSGRPPDQVEVNKGHLIVSASKLDFFKQSKEETSQDNQFYFGTVGVILTLSSRWQQNRHQHIKYQE